MTATERASSPRDEEAARERWRAEQLRASVAWGAELGRDEDGD